MKKTLLLGFTLAITLTVFSQSKSFEIGMKSNSFYSSYGRFERENAFTKIQTKDIDLLGRLQGELFLNRVDTNGKFFRLSLGYRATNITSKGIRVGDFEGVQRDRFKHVSMALAIGRNYKLDRLQFRFFVELPVSYMVQNYNETTVTRFDSQGGIQDKTVIWSKEPLWFSTGLNVGYSVYYELSKSISIGLETKNGIVATFINGDYETITDVYDGQDNLLQSYTEPDSIKFHSVILSGLDLSVGIRMRL